MRGRSRIGVALCGLFSVALIASCSVGATADLSTATDPIGTPPTATTLVPDCLAPQVLTALGFERNERHGAIVHPDAPEAGPVPEGFAPVLAVACSTGETLTDSSGRWDAVSATRYEGDLTDLVAALAAEPSAAEQRAEGTTCPADSERLDLWLVDAAANAIRVELPEQVCGGATAVVWSALDALEVVDRESYPVRLVDGDQG